MKTKEELNALKEEFETLNRKLAELTEEELAQVVGGSGFRSAAVRAAKVCCEKMIGSNSNKDVTFVVDDQGVDKEYHIYENTVKKDFLHQRRW